jgi:DNA-binding NarL/FixJ family response regulator
MSFSPFFTPTQILVMLESRTHAAAFRQCLAAVWPAAGIRTVTRLHAGKAVLATEPVDLIVTDIVFSDGDVLDFIYQAAVENRAKTRFLVVTARKELHLLSSLKKLPVAGVFDSEGEDFVAFEKALRHVTDGVPYWSASVTEALQKQFGVAGMSWRHLTPAEQLVFSAIGDGSDDEEAALMLGLKAGTILSVRKELHHKLDIRHRGELVRRAAQYGVVHMSAAGVVRPGFAMLQAAGSRSKKAAAAAGQVVKLPVAMVACETMPRSA